jgi:hypothetical protein
MKNFEHQVKSKWYYIFWGIMAVAVCSGQWYVGSGYREMAAATKSTEISVSCIIPYEKTKNKTGEFE